MEENGLTPNQVIQIRGYADQKLRRPNDPLDASNRRITVIVQYIVKDEDADAPAKENEIKPAKE